jgi:hypothetical protein
MTNPGTLTVERDGPHVKFAFEFASDEYSHAWSVERYHGMKKKRNALGEVVLDPDGNPVMEEDWRHVHTGTRKFIRGDASHDWKMHHPEDANPIPHGEHTFRALAYKIAERCPSGVIIQETNGVYSSIVTG